MDSGCRNGGRRRSGGPGGFCAERAVLRDYLGFPGQSAGTSTPDTLVNVRAGQHTCYDRLVVDVTDFDGSPVGYSVRYVPGIGTENGELLPLRGGAFLLVSVQAPTHDPNGMPTYSPANPAELVNVNAWRTFRQASLGDSFEGVTVIGLGVRARLLFRVFTLDGPATDLDSSST